MSRFLAAAVIVVLSGLTINRAFAQEDESAPSARAEPEEVLFKIFALEHADAEDMQRIVGDLFGGQRGQAELRTSWDPRTNSLIVAGAESELTVIEALVQRLDEPTPQREDRAKPTSSLNQRVRQLEAISQVRDLEAIAAQVAVAQRNVARAKLALEHYKGLFNRGYVQRSEVDSHVSRLMQAEQALKQAQTTNDSLQRFRIPVPPGAKREAAPARQPQAAKPVAGTQVRVEIRAPSGQPLKLKSIVAAGKSVKKGDLLVEIDAADLEDAIKTQQVATAQAKAAAIQSEANMENSVLRKETLVAQGKLQLDVAKIALREFQEGTQPLQLEVHAKEINEAKQKLAELQKRAEAGQIDATSVDKAKVALAVAEKKLEVFKKFSVPKQLVELEGEIKVAERKLDQSRREADAAVKAAQADLQARRVQADMQARRLAAVERSLAKYRITAPHDGVVAAIGPPLRAGSLVREGQAVLVVAPQQPEKPLD